MTDRDALNHGQRGSDRAMLERRAVLLGAIRRFMDQRSILEVETPVLSRYGNTDPHLNSLVARTKGGRAYYLHTSPEFAMKRLLAAGSGSIYQVCRVFRDDPGSPLHLREFTMLEWYRTGFDHHDLMDEISDLLLVLGLPGGGRRTYAEVFRARCGLDPHGAELSDLRERAREAGLDSPGEERSILLDFLFSHLVMPGLGADEPVQVYDFPACQAALARVSGPGAGRAERFELFIKGIEIANGYNELTDYIEVKSRFERENESRRERGLDTVPMDELLLDALRDGLPPCAGVALGLDRLLMVLYMRAAIRDVTALTGYGDGD